MPNHKDFIVEQLKKQIAGFKVEVEEKSVGRVLKISDEIGRAHV